ncbi:MAG: cyclic-di-AMP receptor [Clostridiaceae bacterium]|nr:cyclic-di-AMP receptor [Clostridiales bacterium]MDD6877665.1 cyclic-di-AMP receptor [Clostridiaceae bacterium]MDY3071637.1 cyclic-di-AMP receptor [Eubacteriales bacterium]MDY3284981.1 cyclic-di-AMP receptor [Eubacteriales bacterium]MDY5015861.1 cyclic-di-AMP receptor [Eubacteriales bacterium]
MKMILAIINQDDANMVVNALMQEGYSVTKLSTTGGFLRAGNMTILIGVEDEKVPKVLNIIHKQSHSRRQVIPTASELGMGYYPSMPVEVTVGGATVFVLNVDQFQRL